MKQKPITTALLSWLETTGANGWRISRSGTILFENAELANSAIAYLEKLGYADTSRANAGGMIEFIWMDSQRAETKSS